VLHQRCWVQKMRNILEHVRKRDYDEVKRDAQAIYWAESRRQAEAAFRHFRRRWQRDYGAMVRRLESDLPESLVSPLPPTAVEETARYQHHGALLCRGASPHPADGVLCQCPKRGPNHVLHLPAI
jgi:hypothetical protein